MKINDKRIARNDDFECIECGDAFDTGDICYVHPEYSNERVCEDCYVEAKEKEDHEIHI